MAINPTTNVGSGLKARALFARFGLVLLFSFIAACTSKKQNDSKIRIALPNTTSTSQKVGASSLNLSTLNVDAAGWLDAVPQDAADFTCYLVMVGGPEDVLRKNNCTMASGATLRYGVTAGLAPGGGTLEIEVPSGSKREINIFALKALNGATACKDFSTLTRNQYSAPLRIGQSIADLTPGDNVVTIQASINATDDNRLRECAGIENVIDPTASPNPTVQFNIASSNTAGSESGSYTVSVSLSAASTKSVTIPLTVNASSTAISSTDYALSSNSIVIAAGATSGSVTISATSDLLDENDETVVLEIGTPVNATASGITSHTFTINDDDATPTLSISNATANEASTLNFTVSLSAISGRNVTFTFNANSGGTATASTDYTPNNGQVFTIGAGLTTNTISVASLHDTLDESNETFDAHISGALNATIALGTGTGTIIDDDGPPTLNIGSATSVEGSNLVFTVSLTSVSGADVTFDWASSNGTALSSDSDYTPGTGAGITIPAGQTSVTLNIPTGNDSKDEADESITVTLSNISGATVGTITGTGTIQDDDAAPTVQFSVATQNSAGVESGVMNIQVNLSAISGKVVAVPVTVNGSSNAINPSDYVLSANTLTITPGSTSASLSLTVASDTIDENDEIVVLDLGVPTNATVGGISSHTATINDDDAMPSLSISDAAGAEGSNLNFTVSLTAISGLNVTFTVNANAGGDATVGTDYTSVTGLLLTIPAGSANTVFTVATTNDSLDEANEYFTAVLSSPANASIADGSANGTINDDDLPPAVLSVVGGPAYDFGSQAIGSNTDQTFTISNSGGQPANSLSDAGITYPFSYKGGTYPGTGGTCASSLANSSSCTIVITYSPGSATYIMSPSDLSYNDGANIQNLSISLEGTGLSAAVIAISDGPTYDFTNVSVGSSVDKTFTVTNTGAMTATSMTGYGLTTPFLFKGGTFPGTGGTCAASLAAAANCTIVITYSPGVSGAHSDSVDISYNNGIGTANTSRSVQGTGSLPQISVSDVTITEGGNAVFTVSLDVTPGFDVTFNWATSNGTAVGSDFTTSSGTATILSGNTSTQLTVSTTSDPIDENDETFNVTLSAPANGTLLDNTGIGTITDDDAEPVIAIANSSITEGSGLVFTITSSAVSGKDITFTFGAYTGGNASTATDYAAVAPVTLTILAGQTSVTKTVPTAVDTLDEVDETFDAVISSPVNATLGADTGVGTILDDDATPSISLSGGSITEGGGVVFTITSSAVSGQNISFTFSTTTDITATSGTDYTPVSNRLLTITAGLPSVTTTVNTISDALDEPNETFTAAIFGPSASATLSVASATGTINDDDAAPTLSIAPASASEGANIVFTVTLSSVSGQNISFTVNANTGGNAITGTDYTSVTNQVLTILAGQNNTTFSVTTTSDPLYEVNETFNAIISGPSAATLGTASAIGTINDDDPIPTLSVSGSTGSEPSGGVALTVTLSAVSGQQTTFTVNTIAGSATSGADYTALSNVAFTIPSGSPSATPVVTVINDSLYENNEMFTLTITSASGANIAIGSATATITSEDSPPSLSVSDAVVSEGQDLVFTVTQSAVSGVISTFSWSTAAGGAPAGITGEDYLGFGSTPVTISAGSTSVSLTVPTNIDEHYEGGPGTMTVNLTSPVNASIADNTGIGTINDIDPIPVVQFKDPPPAIPENGGVTLTIMTSAVSEVAANFTLSVTGSATPGTDHNLPASSGFTIGSSATHNTITLTPTADAVAEPTNETVILTLASPTNSVLGPLASYTIVILDDDSAAPSAPPPVFDGDVHFSVSGNAAPKAVWDAAVAGLNGPATAYEIAIGTTPGGTDKMGWTNISNVLNYQPSGTFASFTRYYTSVRAKDSTTATSGETRSDGWASLGMMKVSDPVGRMAQASGAGYGTSIAISEDGLTLVIGAPHDDMDASGANSLVDAGAAFVYVRSGNTWSLQQKLVQTNRQTSDMFGISVDISGETIVVGSHGQDYDAANTNMQSSAGAAYVFTRTSSTWSQQAKLVAFGTNGRMAGDQFGSAVAISGETIVVGAWKHDFDVQGGVNAADAGAAFVFTRSVGVWNPTQKLVGTGLNGRNPNDQFGNSVAIDQERIVVSSYAHDYDASGGNPITDAGAAFVFAKGAAGWVPFGKLVGQGTNGRMASDQFGDYVSIDGDTIGIGAPQHDYDPSGSGLATNAGAVFIFKRGPGNWMLQQKVAEPAITGGRAANNAFGKYFGISKNTLVVGSPGNATDMIGGTSISGSGAAWIFSRNGISWQNTGKLAMTANRTAGDGFGEAVAISGETIAVGARYHDLDSAGANANTDAGAAFIYTPPPP